MPELPPDLQAAQTRAVQYADKLFAALDDLREAGGLADPVVTLMTLPRDETSVGVGGPEGA